MSSQIDLKPQTSWSDAFSIYLNRRVLEMLFLGFSAGLPLFLIFSTLSLNLFGRPSLINSLFLFYISYWGDDVVGCW